MKPLFFKQETASSCLPACLRMVLSTYGVEVSESELRLACDCTIFGTDALNVVDAARRYGFANTAKHTLSIDDLTNLVESGSYPIVLVSMLPIDGIRETHALVVHFVSQDVRVLDPSRGERLLPIQSFSAAWAARSNVAIVVER